MTSSKNWKFVTFKSADPVWDKLIQMQRIDDKVTKTTDVHIECPDGSVPAHALILLNCSSFFAEVFMSQGENYPTIRTVLMPDYEILHVSKAIQVIYTGSVEVENSDEADVIKEILTIWKIGYRDVQLCSIPINESYEKPIPIMYYTFSDDEDKEIEEEKEIEVDKEMEENNEIDEKKIIEDSKVMENKEDENIEEDKNIEGEDDKETEEGGDIDEDKESEEGGDIDEDKESEEGGNIDEDKESEEDGDINEDKEIQENKEIEEDEYIDQDKENEEIEVDKDIDKDKDIEEDCNSIMKYFYEYSDAEEDMGREENNKFEVDEDTSETPSEELNFEIDNISINENISNSSCIVSDSIAMPRQNKPISREGKIPSTSSKRCLRSWETLKKEGDSSKRCLRPRETLKKKLEYLKDNSDDSPEDSEEEKDEHFNNVEILKKPSKKCLRPMKTLKKKVKHLKDNSDDSTEDSEEEKDSSSSTDSEPELSNPKRISTIPRLPLSRKRSAQQNSTNTRSHSQSTSGSIFGYDSKTKISKSIVEVSSSSDSESSKDDEKEILYTNPKKFLEAAKKCGKCKKTYKNSKEASDCITELHKLVRCYFCLDVCNDTDVLFQHYATKHKKSERKDTLLCPFCQQSVPYKSVSTHVISNHLSSTGTTSKKSFEKVEKETTQNPLVTEPERKRIKMDLIKKQVQKSGKENNNSESKAKALSSVDESDDDEDEDTDDN